MISCDKFSAKVRINAQLAAISATKIFGTLFNICARYDAAYNMKALARICFQVVKSLFLSELRGKLIFFEKKLRKNLVMSRCGCNFAPAIRPATP